MDKIKYSLFDLFSYLFPGFIVINVWYITNSGFNIVTDFRAAISAFTTGITTYFFIYTIVIAYCIGLIIQVLGQLVMLGVGKIKFLKPVSPTHHSSVDNSTKYCVIRHKSPANFSYIELWNVFSSFSANLAVVIFLSGIYLKIKFSAFTWHIHVVLFVAVIGCFFYLAKQFNDWAIIDMDNTYKLITDGSIKPPAEK